MIFPICAVDHKVVTSIIMCHFVNFLGTALLLYNVLYASRSPQDVTFVEREIILLFSIVKQDFYLPGSKGLRKIGAQVIL